MMGRLFGTDGVRGEANVTLTPELALALGRAAGSAFLRRAGQQPEGERPVAVLGQDSRISGEMLIDALAAGLMSAGLDVAHLGVLPTPGVALVTNDSPAVMGAMISASHNPAADNGIKFFDANGDKLPDDVEDEIDAAVTDPVVAAALERPVGTAVGRWSEIELGRSYYEDHLLGTLTQSLAGLHVVLDCANGAASEVAPAVFRAAGATVTTMSAEPDGININADCGSTHPQRLQELVPQLEADCGFAFDGDADRCLAVSATGELVDGDEILLVLARAKQRERTLAQDGVAITVMANLGLRRAFNELNIHTVETGVGDRYVLEAMKKHGYVLGGEQSGHVILTEYATTGDGVLTALQLAQEMAQTQQSLAQLAAGMQRIPQVLINVRNVDKSKAASHEAIQAAVSTANTALGDTGRVLLRPSGTEPVVRVMVEAIDSERAHSLAGELADLVAEHLSLDTVHVS